MVYFIAKCIAWVFFMVLFSTSFVDVSRFAALAEEESQAETDCNIHKTSCAKTVSGHKVILDINPKPVKSMTDLTFSVIIPDKEPGSNPYIDLGMPRMTMGPNRVELEKNVESQSFEGKGIIVRCPSGRKTWQADVTIPGVGTAEFVFDVMD